ncbi:MAG TPA: hypothetical protein VGB18_08670 [Candidatus Thermoplasmatota archaeon]
MPDESAFSYETLSKQDASERKQPRLGVLEPTFWQKLSDYLRGLEKNLRNEAERNPTSRKIALIQDELRNATRKSESLWEMREKKITLQALKNSRLETPPAPENALKTEQALYFDLCAAFRKHLPTVVHDLEKPSEAPPLPPLMARPTSAAMPASNPNVMVAPAPTISQGSGPPAPPQTAPTSKSADDAVTVRALVDVPPFVGLDGKTYRLKKGDILTLPKKMVDMLAKRGQVAVMA